MTATTRQNKSTKLQQLQKKHSDRFSGRASQRSFQERNSRSSGATAFKSRSLTKTVYTDSMRNLHSFFFLIMSLLLVWGAYRFLVRMPVWFDEGIAKAIVFGLPVAWLTARSRFMVQNIGLNPSKLFPGLNFGLGVGGLYGFAVILSQMLVGREIVAGDFFLTNTFLWMAAMALLTAWWESLFFFALPVQYIRSVAGWISDAWIGIFVVVVFLLFHAPLRLVLTGGSPEFLIQIGILALFAIGQFIVYTRTRNLYAVILSHFFWGLVLEVYSQTLV